ncbi:hypothetical protein FACS1894200_05210 [Spirochaetia bacterium]|nr:hypothetical protein FACS1894200_05210 [Spirochaetia bacterium]
MGNEPDAIELSHTYLMINGAFYVALALLFNFRQTLLGLGNSMVPTLAGIMELVMRTFAAIILSQAFGFVGICFASPLAWFGALVPLSIAVVITFKKINRQMLT